VIYRGQMLQDAFAYEIFGERGTYIEIGAAFPKTYNNTYSLEVDHNWQGFSLEISRGQYQSHWNSCVERKNKVYWENALTFDYKQAIIDNNLSMHINYLSCDIEPPNNTFAALQRVIDQGITFDCITFEHDLYCHPNPNYDIISKEFLASRGYKPAVINVDAGSPYGINETWFVKNDIEYKAVDFKNWLAKTKGK